MNSISSGLTDVHLPDCVAVVIQFAASDIAENPHPGMKTGSGEWKVLSWYVEHHLQDYEVHVSAYFHHRHHCGSTLV